MNRPINVNNDEDGNAVGEIDLEKMKAYIAYCRRFVHNMALFDFFFNLSALIANVHLDYLLKHKKC